MEQLAQLRAVAVNKQLDMTDAFSEYAGTGRDANLGIMSKARFTSAVGFLFAGAISRDLLKAICYRYGTGDRDLTE